MKRVRRRFALGLPITVYVASLVMPVANPFTRWPPPHYGFDAFEIGFRATFLVDGWSRDRVEVVAAWLANPAMWVAFGCLIAGRWRAAAVAAALACVLSAAVLPSWARTLVDYPGYWVWSGSAWAALVVAWFVRPRRRQPEADDFGPMSGPPASVL